MIKDGEMDVKEYIKFLLPEEIYVMITIVYLRKLDSLNKQLFSIRFESPLDLLVYDDSKPVWYFIVAVCLFIVGGIIIYHRVKSVFRKTLCFGEVVSSMVSIVVIISFLVLIYIFINNPILRAVLVAVAAGIAAICAFAK